MNNATLSSFDSSQRIVWIDTAKGVCISLVVLSHVAIYLNTDYAFASLFRTFRMPLYYILSGLFFKPYDSWKTFFTKKSNNLLVPYIFFFLVTGVLLPIFMARCFGLQMLYYNGYNFEAVKYIFTEHAISNPSIWFLVSLFEVNALFYFLHQWTQRVTKSYWLIVVVACMVGAVGLLLYEGRINLPYYLDTSLTMLPFFLFGWWLKKKSHWLSKPIGKWGNIVSWLAVSIAGLLLIYFCDRGCASFRLNSFGDWKGVLQLYPFGILGTMAVLILSKLSGRVPILSTIGRYSIIVLCIHLIVIQLLGFGWKLVAPLESCPLWLFFILTLLANWVLIPIIVRFMPHVTAQKNLIPLPILH